MVSLVSQVRVGCDTVVEEFVAQVQEYLMENLSGAEWACRKVAENGGEVPWVEVEALCGGMKIESLLQVPTFYPWFNKLNRNRTVSIQTLLDKWLAEENRTVAEDAERYSALLAHTRELAGEERMLTRSEAQMLTKEFDPRFAEGSKLAELMAFIKVLFQEWADPETKEKVPYLNLVIAWIQTRDFRRAADETDDKAAVVANFTGNR